MELPAQRKDRYVLIGEESNNPFAKGSFGKVFSGWDRVTNMNVAMKKQQAASTTLARELATHRSLLHDPHRNVMRMFDAFVHDDSSVFLVFEMGERTLWALAKTYQVRQGRLESERIAELIGGAICGVGHLHGVDLVHGDLSAANILIGRDGRAIIGDLATAHSPGDRKFLVWDRTTQYIRAPEY